jgi:hypothetical protein
MQLRRRWTTRAIIEGSGANHEGGADQTCTLDTCMVDGDGVVESYG